MLGQTALCKTLAEQIVAGTFPRFCIFVGPAGSGKKTISKWVAEKMSAQLYNCSTGVADIRSMIEQSYKTATTTVYLISDCDSMSIGAKNALLKVTEEPPMNAFFIMTLQSTDNTLDTIRSRGSVYVMNRYSTEELLQYASNITTILDIERNIIDCVCDNPGDVNLLISYGIESFYNYVLKVFNNILKVSGTNAFKIGSSIALRSSESDKYELSLFWRAFISICLSEMTNVLNSEVEDAKYFVYYGWISITTTYLQSLRINGVNKQMRFDNWVLDIRKEGRTR